jgi:hypothetical protein
VKVPQPTIQEPINGLIQIGWRGYFSQLTTLLSGYPTSGDALPNYVNDAAAKAGGVKLYGYYRNGSIVMQRVV